MKRNVSLEEISDGRLYGLNDMVKADCHDCEGCSACCKGMGSSIVLDPLDVYELSVHLGRDAKSLMADCLELHVADGIILPSLKMAGEEERCVFLDRNGRCSVHPFRPGICRLFPLGRYYEDGEVRYFLQVHECRKENRTKVKVRQWIGMADGKRYEKFVKDWHYFLKGIQEAAEYGRREELARKGSLYVLTQFYLTPYREGEDFYPQFDARLEKAVEWVLGL